MAGLESVGMDTLLLLTKIPVLGILHPWAAIKFSKVCPSRLAGRVVKHQAGRQTIDQLPKYLHQTLSVSWPCFPGHIFC